MKTYLLAAFLLVLISSSQSFARGKGGQDSGSVVYLEPCQKLVSISQEDSGRVVMAKRYGLIVLTRPMRKGEPAETYEYRFYGGVGPDSSKLDYKIVELMGRACT